MNKGKDKPWGIRFGIHLIWCGVLSAVIAKVIEGALFFPWTGWFMFVYLNLIFAIAIPFSIPKERNKW